MILNPIRYRFAILLLGAASALVANPVLHAFSHDHHDHFACSDHVEEQGADVQGAVQELCPYCDAVSQYVEPPTTEASNISVVLLGDSESLVILYPDLRLRLSTRLRAPPFPV